MTPETILLVEDEETSLFRSVARSSARGTTSPGSANGREAFDGVDDGHVDIVILDLGLPDMDGLDVCRGCATRLRRAAS